MHHLEDPLFQLLFHQLTEPRLLLKANSPNFTVITGNRAWHTLTGVASIDFSGQTFNQAFQQINSFADYRGQAELSLQQAIHTREKTVLEAFFSNTRSDAWWEIEFLPVLDSKELEILYVMCSVHDVSNQVKDKHALSISQKNESILLQEQQALNEELSAINEELMQSQESLSALNQDLEFRVENRTAALAESESRFRAMVEQSTAAMLVFRGDEMVINIANAQMLELLGKSENIIDKPLLKVLPEIEGQPILDILYSVYHSGEAASGTELPVTLVKNARPIIRYFNFTYTPLKEDGKITGILEVATDVTEMVNARKQVEESARRFTAMVMTTPVGMCIIKSRQLIIEVANQPILDLWGRTSDDVLGQELLTVFPELEGQPYPALLHSIFDKKARTAFPELPVVINLRQGGSRQLYIDFSYDPLFDAAGNVEAVLVSVKDITELVRGRTLLQERQEALEAFNEEFAASNEELMATNEELIETQATLEKTIQQLANSENRLSSLFNQAPVGMCFLSGEDLVIDLVNNEMLRIWGRSEQEVLGKPHKLARPELHGQAIHGWMDEVYRTGKTRHNTALKVNLYYQGGSREAYVNSIYHPLTDQQGKVTGLLIILSEITDQILATRKADRTQEQLRLAVESAQLGTWYVNTETQEFVASARTKELFGFLPEDDMSFEAAIAQITDEYRQSVIDAIEATLQHGGSYDIEYPVIGYHDHKVRWIKATGKLYEAESGQPAHFSGTKMDITNRKLEEIRKSDFIAIASHELKTPLTSLKAYLQVMRLKAEKTGDDNFFIGALIKSLVQVDKMQALIKGFLDVARSEAGKLRLNLLPFDIDVLLKEAAEEATLLYPTHNIKIVLCEKVMVMADRDKIAQVLSNFLSNAIKYSPKGKIVELNCSQSEKEVRISVRDEGMGIKPQELDKLFDRFYRVESKHTKTISGFGIGLYLCSEIIKLHDGRIWVNSELGRGSTFTFALPLS